MQNFCTQDKKTTPRGCKLLEADAEQDLYDQFFIDDAVTGNGSGFYTFNSAQSLDYVMSNLNELENAADEFGYDDLQGWTLSMLQKRGKYAGDDIFYDYMRGDGSIDWETLFKENGLAEDADVTIRCYLLGEVLNDVLNELEDKIWGKMDESRRRFTRFTGRRKPLRRGRPNRF